ncbi:stalk domain-containing protein [Tissierella carlieri]|uniref:stalk domain-containing protein n=1 Tax=Tissierella carlieri TaxID=689904 RepID=UPI003868D911
MKNMKKKAVAVLGAATILGTSVFTGVMAAGTDVVGKIANMTIFNNGAAMSLPADQKPIIVNNRTYLPVRALGEALDKNIDWTASNPNSVYITDKSGQNQQDINYLLQQITKAQADVKEKDAKIVTLEDKVKELEAKLKEQDDKVGNLSDLEKKLNRDYGDYKKVRLDIVLKGDKDEVKVDVVVSKADRGIWDDLYDKERKDLVEDIVYAIQKEYKNASVKGYVNSGLNSTSLDFYTDKRGDVQYYGTGSSSGSYLTATEMKAYLENRYRNDVDRVSVSVSGYNVDVEVDLYKNLYDSEIRDLVDEMKSDIVYQMKDVYKQDILIKVYYKNQKVY